MTNEIKPPGGFAPFVNPAAGNSGDTTRETSFQKSVDGVRSSESSSRPPGSLAAIGQFCRTELQDPDKVEVMVRASVSELIDSSESLTGALSAAEKQSLLDFLSQDPLVRGQLESYLRKVLV